jgi:DinB family protein
MNKRPERSEAAEYYFTYIDKVADGDIGRILESQSVEFPALLEPIPEAQSNYRYAADKWSIREVVAHVNDCERLFVFRAFWFARRLDSPLPSFDQNVALKEAGANQRSWRGHIDEFRAIRAATLSFFRNLPSDAWDRRGIASDNPFTVRALAYITAGHVMHHVGLLNERYRAGISPSR